LHSRPQVQCAENEQMAGRKHMFAKTFI
jgi:hypothetical protein